MRMLLDDKRADIPTVILVIGVLVICVLALLSFLKINSETKNSFLGIKIMEKAYIEIERGNLEHHLVQEIRRPGKAKERIIFSVEYNSQNSLG